MDVPAGWHPDPLPPQPGQPPQLRYWDGTRWTEHTSPIQPVHQAYYGGPAYGGGPTTPDGVPLAGWWARVGATVIDSLILMVIYAVCWIPFYGQLVDAYNDYLDELETSLDNGTSTPMFGISGDLAATFAIMGAVGVVVSLVWTVAWLRTKQATPGKMALGLQVRLRDAPGQMSYRTILVRWLTQTGAPGVVGLVPVIGNFTFLYTLLDSLWPLWDDKNQAIHDKAAKTNVVRVR